MSALLNSKTKTLRYHELDAQQKKIAYQSWLKNALLHPASHSYLLDMLLFELKRNGVNVLAEKGKGTPVRQITVTQVKLHDGEYNVIDKKGVRGIKVALSLYYYMTERPYMYGYLKDVYLDDFKSNVSGGFYKEYFRKQRYSKLWRLNLRTEIDCIGNKFFEHLRLNLSLNPSLTVKEHLENALQEASKLVVEKDKYALSEQMFSNVHSKNYLFDTDGAVISPDF